MSDVRLLQTLANSMSIALENARLFDETQRLLKETEQRNAELAVINSIQEGMAAELDFQAIIDLVGDKLREVFKSENMSITLATTPRPIASKTSTLEHGVRLPRRAAGPKPDGPFARMLRARRAQVFNNPAEIRAAWIRGPSGNRRRHALARERPDPGRRPRSGEIMLEDYERETPSARRKCAC